MIKKQTFLYDILVMSANQARSLQRTDGSMPSGHNGPYLDLETPVRNTGHWLMIFLKVFDITKDKTYLDMAKKNLNYLLSRKARPIGNSFWHRKNVDKDLCNGLMGQAWTIEALTFASEYFPNINMLNIAKEVFLLHPFDYKRGLWNKLEIDGRILSFDQTFNHQLWFAAIGSMLNSKIKDAGIHKRILVFLNKLDANLSVYPSGLIQHHLKAKNLFDTLQQGLLDFVKKGNKGSFLIKVREILLDKFYNHFQIKNKTSNQRKMNSKAIGYHQFNLYAFAILYEYLPENKFWKSDKFQLIWKYANSMEFESDLENNRYGYPYNPPGIEMAYALEKLGRNQDNRLNLQKKWLSKQVERSFNFKSNYMDKNTEDRITFAARIYEAIRLPNIEIN